jgi:hypothetical protein
MYDKSEQGNLYEIPVYSWIVFVCLFVCYSIILSISRQQCVGDRMANDYGKVSGTRIGG